MNKKGLMIKFLVTIVLALIIFAPACAISSKLFRLSSQAKENFVSFIDEIEVLHRDGENNEQKTSILILDEGSFISLFKEGTETVSLRSGSMSFSRPLKRCWDKACACLCREFSVAEGSSSITCSKVMCEDLMDNVLINSWAFERNDDEEIDAYHFRRASIQLKKINERIKLTHFSESEYTGDPDYDSDVADFFD